LQTPGLEVTAEKSKYTQLSFYALVAFLKKKVSVNQEWYSHKTEHLNTNKPAKRLYAIVGNETRMKPKDVKPKMRERKLGSGANWRAAIKQNVKQGLIVYVHVI